MRFFTLCLVALVALLSAVVNSASAQHLLNNCGEVDIVDWMRRVSLFPPSRECGPKLVDLFCRARAGQSTVNLVDKLRDHGCLDKYARILPVQESTLLHFKIADEKRRKTSNLPYDAEFDTVRVQHLPGLRYLTILNFLREDTFLLVDRALSDVGPNDRVIIDLRGNPGGLTAEAIKVAELFAPRGGMTLATELSPKGLEQFVTKAPGRLAGTPVLFLVNSATASAGEILVRAGKLSRPNLVSVMGRRTYGKAMYQSLYFYGREVEIAVTTGEVVVGPDQERIEGQGVQPDYELTVEFMAGGRHSFRDPTVMHAMKYLGFFQK